MSIDLSNKNNYEILDVKEYSTNSEITERYKQLKEKYSEDRFLPGEAGNDAASMLQAIEQAYLEIMTERKADGFTRESGDSISNREPNAEHVNAEENITNNFSEKNETQNESGLYVEVDNLIKAGKIDEAQNKLDEFDERLAEWHYLQAVIYYKKNWGHECKKQMEIAITKDPQNKKYKDSYEKLCKEMEYKNKNFTYGNAEPQGTKPNKDFDPYDRQMGGNDCLNSCCQCIACNMLLNCCCNCG